MKIQLRKCGKNIALDVPEQFANQGGMQVISAKALS
jgi:hypothetical protein